MSTQPKALRLADALEDSLESYDGSSLTRYCQSIADEAADELRFLHGAKEHATNLINAMRETMARQSQVITDLRQQIESLEGKTAQPQQTPTTPTHSWGKITEVDGGFKGEPAKPEQEFTEIYQWRRIDRPKQTGWFDDTKDRAYYSDPARLEGRTVYVKKVDTN